jgi:hypothetical protein
VPFSVLKTIESNTMPELLDEIDALIDRYQARAMLPTESWLP